MEGHFRLVDSPCSSFLFVLGVVSADAPACVVCMWCSCIGGCLLVVALFIKRGESLFRGVVL